jgi:hypothetical protein
VEGKKMTIEVTENLRGFVFAPFSDRADLMVALMQKEDGKYWLKGRSRFYAMKDDPKNPFEAEDRKTWFESKHGEDKIETLLEQVDQAVEKLRAASETFGFGGEDKVYKMMRGAEQPLMEFLDEWMAQPFVFKREVKEGDPDFPVLN